jgi:hypothetical protein
VEGLFPGNPQGGNLQEHKGILAFVAVLRLVRQYLTLYFVLIALVAGIVLRVDGKKAGWLDIGNPMLPVAL